MAEVMTVLVVTLLTLVVLVLALRFTRGEFFCGVRGGVWVEDESVIEYCITHE